MPLPAPSLAVLREICDNDVMAALVTNGAQILCDMGDAPSVLTVLPGPPHAASAPDPAMPLATVDDFVPLLNISTFGICNSLENPAVIAATAAAEGVFTPAPCVPEIAGPWLPPQPVAVSGVPVIDQTATCRCIWGGVVAVVDPGQVSAETDL